MKWNAADVISVHFEMMWFVMCLLSWELGADADVQNIT